MMLGCDLLAEDPVATRCCIPCPASAPQICSHLAVRTFEKVYSDRSAAGQCRYHMRAVGQHCRWRRAHLPQPQAKLREAMLRPSEEVLGDLLLRRLVQVLVRQLEQRVWRMFHPQHEVVLQ